MASHVENNAELCDPENPWAVVDDDSGESLGCFASEEEANEKLAEVSGPGGEAAGIDVGSRFEALLAVEGHETADGRMFELDSMSWRDLPVPLMMQIETGPGGHVGAWFGGAVEEIIRDPGEPSRILAAGHFAGPRAAEAEAYIRAGLRGVSVDVSGSEVVVEGFEPDEQGQPTRWLERFGDGRIMGATVTPFAAFEETQVWLPDEMPAPAVVSQVKGEKIEHGSEEEPMMLFLSQQAERRHRAGLIAACAECAPGWQPPAAWFTDPHFDGPTPFTVTDDGEIYGHIGIFGTCHVGRDDRCVPPPHSASDYAYFNTGEVVCDDGSRVAVGRISMCVDPEAEGHENDMYASAPRALAHYDNTGLVVADVRGGEDRYGPWVHGAVRYGLPEARVAALRSSAPSGDWRPIGIGDGELVHVLAVNSGGFPVPRARVTANGEVKALVAAAAPHRSSDHTRLARIEMEVAALRRLIRREVLARLDAREQVRTLSTLDRRMQVDR